MLQSGRSDVLTAQHLFLHYRPTRRHQPHTRAAPAWQKKSHFLRCSTAAASAGHTRVSRHCWYLETAGRSTPRTTDLTPLLLGNQSCVPVRGRRDRAMKLLWIGTELGRTDYDYGCSGRWLALDG